MSYQILFGVYGLLLLILTVMLLLTIRQVGILSLRIGPSGSRTTGDGPSLGSDQSATRFLSQLVSTTDRLKGRNILISFVSPYCVGCRILFPVLKTVAAEERNELAVVAVCRSINWRDAAEIRKELGKQVLLLEDEQIFDEWGIAGTPYCVLVSREGQVAAKGVANTPEHVESLLTALEMGAPTFEDYIERSLSAPSTQPVDKFQQGTNK